MRFDRLTSEISRSTDENSSLKIQDKDKHSGSTNSRNLTETFASCGVLKKSLSDHGPRRLLPEAEGFVAYKLKTS